MSSPRNGYRRESFVDVNVELDLQSPSSRASRTIPSPVTPPPSPVHDEEIQTDPQTDIPLERSSPLEPALSISSQAEFDVQPSQQLPLNPRFLSLRSLFQPIHEPNGTPRSLSESENSSKEYSPSVHSVKSSLSSLRLSSLDRIIQNAEESKGSGLQKWRDKFSELKDTFYCLYFSFLNMENQITLLDARPLSPFMGHRYDLEAPSFKGTLAEINILNQELFLLNDQHAKLRNTFNEMAHSEVKLERNGLSASSTALLRECVSSARSLSYHLSRMLVSYVAVLSLAAKKEDVTLENAFEDSISSGFRHLNQLQVHFDKIKTRISGVELFMFKQMLSEQNAAQVATPLSLT